MVKFQFSILAQNRLKIDSIAIMGKDREDAERKLRQMYRYCEVLSCEIKTAVSRFAPAQKQPEQEKTSSMEEILTLIST